MNSTEAIVNAFSNVKIDNIVNDKEKIKIPIEKDLINSQQFRDIILYMYELYLRKNKDYGNSFNLTLDEFGLIASAIRLSDKFNRFKSLIKSNAIQNIKDESIKDTLADMANYCVMTIMYMNKNEDKCD